MSEDECEHAVSAPYIVVRNARLQCEQPARGDVRLTDEEEPAARAQPLTTSFAELVRGRGGPGFLDAQPVRRLAA